jgi:hypothetical protein
MNAPKLTLFEKQKNTHVIMEYAAECPNADGSIVGRFLDGTEETLLPLISPSEGGDLYAFAPGKRYKVTGLTLDGNFKLVPLISSRENLFSDK